MNEKHKTETEELLNDLLEDQATERQETEFKRLAEHDPTIIRQFEAMGRQKQLLNALPIEPAPDSLAEEIRSALERKLILGDFSGDEQTIVGASHLYMRRILTTAAMLLLPIGLLSFVVYEIMKSPSVGPAAYVTTSDTLAREDSDNLAVRTPPLDGKLPFNGVLTFKTDRPTAVSNYVEKMVFDLGLINYTIPHRTADTATYQITVPPEKMATLVESLEKVWFRCRAVTLSIADSSNSDTIQIPQVQKEQITELVAEDNWKTLNHLASQYARTNTGKDSQYAKAEPLEPQDIGLDEYPRLAMPILTGNESSTPETFDLSQPTVRLRIQVEGSSE